MDPVSHPPHSPPPDAPSGQPSPPVQRPPTLVPTARTGADRKRRLTSPESPGRRGSEPGSTLANVIDLTTDSPQQRAAAGSSRTNAIDLTAGRDHSPPGRVPAIEPVIPQRPAAEEPILRRTSSGGPARTFDDIVIPPWQPDTEATHCSVCGTPFTFFFRRHHCRKCGKVVCDNCSPHRITLPRQYIVRNPVDEDIPTSSTTWGGERVRVCNPCVPDPNFDPPRPHSANQESQIQTNTTQTPPHPGTPLPSLPGMFSRLRPPPPQPGLAPSHRPSSSLSAIPMPPDHDMNNVLERYRPRRPTVPPPSGPNNTLPSGSNFFPPHLSNAISPFATRPPPYPPPHPHSPPVEVCRRCGMLLPFRTPDGGTDFIRNAHFAGQCGSAAQAQQSLPASHRTQEARAPRSPYGPPPTLFGAYHPAPQPPQPPPPLPPPSSSAPATRPTVPFPSFPPLAVAPHLRRNLLDPPSSSSSSSSSPSQYPNPSVAALGQHNRSFSAGASTSDVRAVAALAPVPAMATYPATEKDCVNAEGEAYECVICLEEFAVGDELGMLECFCKFHRRCIVEWYEKGSGMCPTHKVLGGFTG